MFRNKNLIKDERGQSIIIVALAMVVLLGFTAVAVDAGYLFFQRRHLQNTADAAALAGARELADGDVNNIGDVIAQYVSENDVDASEIEDWSVDGNRVTVELKGNRGLFFARVLGFSNTDVPARAVAAVGPPGGMEGLRPIGVQEQLVEDLLDGVATHIYITKDNFNQIGAGNWGWVNLKHPSNPNSPEQVGYIINGYDGMIYIDQEIKTDTGANLATPAQLNNDLGDALDYFIENGETLYIPIISDTVTNGTSELVTIKGFVAIKITNYGDQSANFWLEAVVDKEAKPFVVGPMDPDAPDYGLKAIALVE